MPKNCLEAYSSTKGSGPEGWRRKERGEARWLGARRVVVPEVDVLARRGAALGLGAVERRGAPGEVVGARRVAARELDPVGWRCTEPGAAGRGTGGLGVGAEAGAVTISYRQRQCNDELMLYSWNTLNSTRVTSHFCGTEQTGQGVCVPQQHTSTRSLIHAVG